MSFRAATVRIRFRDVRTGTIKVERMPRAYRDARLHFHACNNPWLEVC